MAHFQTFLKYLTKKPYQPMTGPKSLSVTFAVSHINGTEIEIWAGFGLVGSTENRVWANYEQLLRAFFSCFHGQKKYIF